MQATHTAHQVPLQWLLVGAAAAVFVGCSSCYSGRWLEQLLQWTLVGAAAAVFVGCSSCYSGHWLEQLLQCLLVAAVATVAIGWSSCCSVCWLEQLLQWTLVGAAAAVFVGWSRLCVSLTPCNDSFVVVHCSNVPFESSSLLSAEKEGIYDNPAMRRAPHAALKGVHSKGPEEDIYGSTAQGQGAEGIYDDPKVVGKGGEMDFSDTGIYDNPRTANGQGWYLSVCMRWSVGGFLM